VNHPNDARHSRGWEWASATVGGKIMCLALTINHLSNSDYR